MRLYYEAIEKVQEESEPDFIRIDVTDLDQSSREQVLELIKSQMAGKDCVLRLHYCRHDEGGMCSSEMIS